MKKILLGGAAIIAMFVGPTMAADMRVKAPVLIVYPSYGRPMRPNHARLDRKMSSKLLSSYSLSLGPTN